MNRPIVAVNLLRFKSLVICIFLALITLSLLKTIVLMFIRYLHHV